MQKGFDIEHRDREGFTPIQLALRGGHIRIVLDLLSEYATVDRRVTNLSPAVARALRDPEYNEKDVKLLLLAGADLSHALSEAIEVGEPQLIRLVLNCGADPNASGGKLLDKALERQSGEIIHDLIVVGAWFSGERLRRLRALLAVDIQWTNKIGRLLLTQNLGSNIQKQGHAAGPTAWM